jgi:hypothetical protein
MAGAPTEAVVTLPVSLGEALDKLTILDIKLQKISNPARKADVQKEYDLLFSSLKNYVDSFSYHYRILRAVNLIIWEIQDQFHGKDTTTEEGARLCRQILIENDRRFRVKAKINALANSALREQKGYDVKRALVYTHLGMGDMVWMNGAVRYLATAYDEVYVVCKGRYVRNAADMYADDPTIKLLAVEDDAELHPWTEKRKLFSEQGFAVYSCGWFAPKEQPAVYDLPNSFYDDMGLPREYRTSYFYVPRTEAAKLLAAKYEGRAYIVVHQQSSVQKLPIVATLRAKGETRLILDLNENHYSRDHPDWELAEAVVNKPIIDYTFLIEGAKELHMIESSLYCLASHLNLSAVEKRVCYEPWGENAERLGIFTTGEKLLTAPPGA